MGLLFFYHCFYTDIISAGILVFKIIMLFILGVLFSLSSKISDIIDSIVNLLIPLKKCGIDPNSIGLLIYLTQTLISILIKEFNSMKSAQAARGIEKNFLLLMIPFLLRVFKMSDYITEAIISRNYGD
jgi:energy-coupling factor transporter transmembrane protein EcfT